MEQIARCGHDHEAVELEIVDLDAIGPGAPYGLANGPFPADQLAGARRILALLAEGYAEADQPNPYRLVAVHTDGCRIPFGPAAPARPAEMFAHLR